MKPGIGMASWSMLTTWPEAVSVLKCFLFFTLLLRVCLRCALPYVNPGQIDASTLASYLGMILNLSTSLSLRKLKCPSCSCIVNSLDCLWWTVVTSGLSRCPSYCFMLKSEEIGLIFKVSRSSYWYGIECTSLELSCNSLGLSCDCRGWSEGGLSLSSSDILCHA